MIDCNRDCPEYKRLLAITPDLEPYAEPNMSTNWCCECVLDQLQSAEGENDVLHKALETREAQFEKENKITNHLIRRLHKHGIPLRLPRNLQ